MPDENNNHQLAKVAYDFVTILTRKLMENGTINHAAATSMMDELHAGTVAGSGGKNDHAVELVKSVRGQLGL
jgi:hypothetical protein